MTPLLIQIGQFWAQIAPFAITGVIVTAAVQAAKQFVDKTGHKIAISVSFSIVGGVVAYFVGAIPNNILTDIVGVLAAANGLYALVIKPLETPAQPPQS